MYYWIRPASLTVAADRDEIAELFDKFNELEKTRLNRLIQYMIKFQSINSAKAADILDIQQQTASRLLAKAEKNHLLESEGRTKNKIYRLKHVF